MSTAKAYGQLHLSTPILRCPQQPQPSWRRTGAGSAYAAGRALGLPCSGVVHTAVRCSTPSFSLIMGFETPPRVEPATRGGASAAQVRVRGLVRQAQLDVDCAVAPQQVGQPGAYPLPNLSSIGARIMIKTDGQGICRCLQHLVAAGASGLFDHCSDRHRHHDGLTTARQRKTVRSRRCVPSTEIVASGATRR